MSKINVGITGSDGFIGKSLSNFFKIKSKINLFLLNKEEFKSEKKIINFVKDCDVIIHLAAINRDNDLNKLYETNIQLVKSLINACEESKSKPTIFFASSTQDTLNNSYGKSKLEGRKLFERWSKKNNTNYTTLIIPNVFGPYCKPFYNSVVSTFCYQLINRETPEIKNDALINFIYVYDLAEQIYNSVTSSEKSVNDIIIKSDLNIKVSDLLIKIRKIHNLYYKKNIFPKLENEFDRNLFITYISYILNNFFPKSHFLNIDSRGEFSELVKAKTMGQFSYSVTKPGIVRGNHFHTRKIERFSVIEGSAVLKIRKINSKEINEYVLNKNNFIDIQPWHTHSIENTGTDNLITLFWINEHYNINDPDTYNEKV